MAPGGGQRTRRAGGLSGQRGGQRETAAGPGADGATTANQRPAAFRESILAHAKALGEPVDPGLAALFATVPAAVSPAVAASPTRRS